jgi:hypothetical protein
VVLQISAEIHPDGSPDVRHGPVSPRDVLRVAAEKGLRMNEPKAKRPGTSSVAALVMARTMQRVAADRGDQEMLAEAVEREPALVAIKLQLPELPAKEKPPPFQLRLPGI